VAACRGHGERRALRRVRGVDACVAGEERHDRRDAPVACGGVQRRQLTGLLARVHLCAAKQQKLHGIGMALGGRKVQRGGVTARAVRHAGAMLEKQLDDLDVTPR